MKERYEYVMSRGAALLIVPYLGSVATTVLGRYSGAWTPPNSMSFWVLIIFDPLTSLTSIVIAAAVINAMVCLTEGGFKLSLALLVSMLSGSLLSGWAAIDYGAWKRLDKGGHVLGNLLFTSSWIPWVFSAVLLSGLLIALTRQRQAVWKPLFVWLLLSLTFDGLALGLLAHYPPGPLVLIQKVLLGYPAYALDGLPIRFSSVIGSMVNRLNLHSTLVSYELTLVLTRLIELAAAFGIVVLVGVLLRLISGAGNKPQTLLQPCPPQD